MRYLALGLLLAAGATNATTLEIAVTEGRSEPQRFSYNLSSDRQTLDLRDSHRYTAAVKDVARKKEICREAEYRTGMLMTLREVEKVSDTQFKIEIIGQTSTLKSLAKGDQLSCGLNQIPDIENRAFSDTSVLEMDRTKAVVVDGKTTLLLTIRP